MGGRRGLVLGFAEGFELMAGLTDKTLSPSGHLDTRNEPGGSRKKAGVRTKLAPFCQLAFVSFFFFL